MLDGLFGLGWRKQLTEVQVTTVFGNTNNKNKTKKHMEETLLADLRRGCFSCTSSQTGTPQLILRRHRTRGGPDYNHLPRCIMFHPRLVRHLQLSTEAWGDFRILAALVKPPGISACRGEPCRQRACCFIQPGCEGGLPATASNCRSRADVGLGSSAVALFEAVVPQCVSLYFSLRFLLMEIDFAFGNLRV